MSLEGKSPAEEQSSNIGFDKLSNEDVVSSFFEEKVEVSADETARLAAEEQQKITEIKIPENPDDKANVGDDKGDNKGDDKGADDKSKQGNEPTDDLKLPGEEDDKSQSDDKSNDDDDSNSWLSVGKALELDVKEDSFDAIKEAFTNKIEAVKAEVQSVKKEDLIMKYDVEAQIIIKGLEAGLTIEQINKPLDKIDGFLKMSAADLVAEDYRLQGWEEDKIEAKILDLTETGKLELADYEIRKELEATKKEISENRLKDIEALKSQQDLKIKEQLNKESDEIHKELKTVQSFMESPIKEKHVEFVMNKWKNGDYHEAFKDPKLISKFLIWNEFGEQAQKNLANKKFQEGRDGIVKKLHNTPPIVSSGGGTPKTENTESPIGNFSILEGVKAEDL
jgi:hypothetical protein